MIKQFSPFAYYDPASTSSLMKAIINGNIEKASDLISKKKNFQSIDNQGNGPLHIAIIYKRLVFL